MIEFASIAKQSDKCYWLWISCFFQCSKYDTLRHSFLFSWYVNGTSIHDFNNLLTSQDTYIIKTVALYMYHLISAIETIWLLLLLLIYSDTTFNFVNITIYHTSNKFPAFPLVKMTSRDYPIFYYIGSATKIWG